MRISNVGSAIRRSGSRTGRWPRLADPPFDTGVAGSRGRMSESALGYRFPYRREQRGA